MQGYRFKPKFRHLSINFDFWCARRPCDYNFCGHKTSGGRPFGPGTHGAHGTHGDPLGPWGPKGPMGTHGALGVLCNFCGHIIF